MGRDVSDGDPTPTSSLSANSLTASEGHYPATAATTIMIDAWNSQLIHGRPWMDGTSIAGSSAREHMVRLFSAYNYAIKSGIL